MSTVIFLELGGKVKGFLDGGIAHYNQSCKAQTPVDPLSCGEAGERAIAGWSPKINGKDILTPSLRGALKVARGHLAFNMAAAQAGHPIR